MNPTEITELKAFIFSLSQLDTPLPEDIQTSINQVNVDVDVNKLYNIAISYPPLAKIYEQVLGFLEDRAEYRNKGIDDIPEYQPERINTEVDNDAVEINKKLIEFTENVDNNQMSKQANQITQARNSVKAAKDLIQTILNS